MKTDGEAASKKGGGLGGRLINARQVGARGRSQTGVFGLGVGRAGTMIREELAE